MAITTSGSSTQYSAIQDTIAGTYNPVQSSDMGGKRRSAFFQVTCAAQDALTYGLCKIPKGSRILGVRWQQSATFGATATIAVGIAGADGTGYYTGTTADSTGFFRVAATSTTTTMQEFGSTVALNYGYQTTKDVYITFTAAAAALPASGTIYGEVWYCIPA